MVKVFQIVSMILAGIAGYFLWTGNTDGVFVSAVLGALCFFLSVRFQVKERVAEHNIDRDSRHSADENEEM